MGGASTSLGRLGQGPTKQVTHRALRAHSGDGRRSGTCGSRVNKSTSTSRYFLVYEGMWKENMRFLTREVGLKFILDT